MYDDIYKRVLLFIGGAIMNAGERIKMLRKQKGISAESIAEKIGVSPSTIYRYENNDIASMKIDNLKSIAKILGVDASYLMGWQDLDTLASVSGSELRLIELSRNLNTEGLSRLLSYAEDIIASGRYNK